jgi:hypothetical protein
VPPTSLSKLPRARGGARRAGVDRRAGSGTTSTDALIIELTEQECRAALLILARADLTRLRRRQHGRGRDRGAVAGAGALLDDRRVFGSSGRGCSDTGGVLCFSPGVISRPSGWRAFRAGSEDAIHCRPAAFPPWRVVLAAADVYT